MVNLNNKIKGYFCLFWTSSRPRNRKAKTILFSQFPRTPYVYEVFSNRQDENALLIGRLGSVHNLLNYRSGRKFIEEMILRVCRWNDSRNLINVYLNYDNRFTLKKSDLRPLPEELSGQAPLVVKCCLDGSKFPLTCPSHFWNFWSVCSSVQVFEDYRWSPSSSSLRVQLSQPHPETSQRKSNWENEKIMFFCATIPLPWMSDWRTGTKNNKMENKLKFH